MKISIICPTYDRLEFMPWLTHVFNGLRCPPGVEKELVVVDSSEDPDPVVHALWRDIPKEQFLYRHVEKPRCKIGVKRNIGLEMANGTHIAWNDDDDGKAPGWIEWALRELGDKEVLRVKTRIPFINIAMTPIRVRWMSTIWYSAGLYTAEAARRVRFNENAPTGEDIQWMGMVMATVKPDKLAFIKTEGAGLTITHRKNIANTGLRTIKYNHDLARPAMWTPEEWETTVAQIKDLKRRHEG